MTRLLGIQVERRTGSGEGVPCIAALPHPSRWVQERVRTHRGLWDPSFPPDFYLNRQLFISSSRSCLTHKFSNSTPPFIQTFNPSFPVSRLCQTGQIYSPWTQLINTWALRSLAMAMPPNQNEAGDLQVACNICSCWKCFSTREFCLF